MSPPCNRAHFLRGPTPTYGDGQRGFEPSGFAVVVRGHHFERSVRAASVCRTRAVHRARLGIDDKVLGVTAPERVLYFTVFSRVLVGGLKRKICRHQPVKNGSHGRKHNPPLLREL